MLGQLATLVVLARLLPPRLSACSPWWRRWARCSIWSRSSACRPRPSRSRAFPTPRFPRCSGSMPRQGALLGGALVLAAPLLAQFYGQPDLEAVTEWLALGFVLSGLTVQHWALLRRQMRFSAIAGLETAADVAGFAVAIALALAGKGYWALVAQRLVSPGLLLAGSWTVCRWRPARPAPAEGLRELLRFGGSVTASGLALALARSVDQILIGWLWGPAIARPLRAHDAAGAVARQYHQRAGLCRRHARTQPTGRPARALSVDVPPDHAEACPAHHAGLRDRRRPGRLAGADPVRAEPGCRRSRWWRCSAYRRPICRC